MVVTKEEAPNVVFSVPNVAWELWQFLQASDKIEVRGRLSSHMDLATYGLHSVLSAADEWLYLEMAIKVAERLGFKPISSAENELTTVEAHLEFNKANHDVPALFAWTLFWILTTPREV